MEIRTESERPIFLQIASGIEDAILSGAFLEETQIPSITEFSVRYKINPATALKGIGLLVETGIIYKKRGLGMFVSGNAVEALREKRKAEFSQSYVEGLVSEAKRLQISYDEIIKMIERGFTK